eukprot:6584850-Prymnesium_polylepis.2
MLPLGDSESAEMGHDDGSHTIGAPLVARALGAGACELSPRGRLGEGSLMTGDDGAVFSEIAGQMWPRFG